MAGYLLKLPGCEEVMVPPDWVPMYVVKKACHECPFLPVRPGPSIFPPEAIEAAWHENTHIPECTLATASRFKGVTVPHYCFCFTFCYMRFHDHPILRHLKEHDRIRWYDASGLLGITDYKLLICPPFFMEYPPYPDWPDHP